MKQLASLLFVLVAMFHVSGFASAQTVTIAPNNINNGGSTTVSVTGLQPNTTYIVKLLGTLPNGTNCGNTERKVTTNGSGTASWEETVSWGAGSYAATVQWRIGNGQINWGSGGTLTVN